MKLRMLAMLAAGLPAWGADGSPIAWMGWTGEAWAKAKAEKRLVLLDLEAVWCHWCHVMDKTTYMDAEVAAILAKGYVAIKVDQEARPDIAAKYEDYGWPATILFDAGGRELAKWSGYMPPERMRSWLQAFLDDPRPGPSVLNERRSPASFAAAAVFPGRLLAELRQDHFDNYDSENGGWGTVHKYLQAEPIEWSMLEARRGDARGAEMARKSLDGALSLIDPVWGGAYQYSDSGVWGNPHFEKIMSTQANNIRIYALASEQFGGPRYREAAEAVRRYVKVFLTSPEGAFYTSQDADLERGKHSANYFALGDEARRARGLPRVDKHIYARENGWMIEALAVLARVSKDRQTLADAERAARWILANRALPGGGFRHGERDAAGPYLGDTLAMGRAFLALHQATGRQEWLDRSEAAARFLDSRFAAKAGYAAAPGGAMQREDNLLAARWFARLLSATGRKEFAKMRDHALRYAATPEVAALRPAASVLLAAESTTVD